MGFKRIRGVWFFSLLSAVAFVALAASLPGGPLPSVETAEAPGVSSPAPLAGTDHAGGLIRPAVRTSDLPPLRETPVGNPDRRKVVMVPVTQAGALLTFEADVTLP